MNTVTPELLGERIRVLLEKRGKTQRDLGVALGAAKSTVSNYINGHRLPDAATLAVIADFLNTSIDHVLGRVEDEAPPGKPFKVSMIPILGRIRAGIPLFSEQNRIGEIAAPDRLARADFALVVSGDSMSGVGIQDGDIVFMSKPGREPAHGDIVAALIGESEATLKWFIRRDATWWLVAANSAYSPIPVDGNVKIQSIYLGLLLQRKPRELDPPIEEWSGHQLLERYAEREGLPIEAVELAMQTVRSAMRGYRSQ